MQHVIYDTTVNNLPVEGTTEEELCRNAERGHNRITCPGQGPGGKKGNSMTPEREWTPGTLARDPWTQQEGEKHSGTGNQQRYHPSRLLRSVHRDLRAPAQGPSRRRGEGHEGGGDPPPTTSKATGAAPGSCRTTVTWWSTCLTPKPGPFTTWTGCGRTPWRWTWLPFSSRKAELGGPPAFPHPFCNPFDFEKQEV